MGRRKNAQVSDDLAGQTAGAIGVLAIAFGALAAIKDKLGLSWPATVLLTAGALVALGYGAWRLRTFVQQCWAREPQSAQAAKQETFVSLLEGPETEAERVPAHPELTAALTTAGVIGREQVIRADEATVTDMSTGTLYDFLVPKGRTYEDVEKRLGTVAGMFGVTRLHLTMERSRDNERRVKLLKLHEPPFTTPFPAPTWQQIETFAGVPLGHDVTGQLHGVPTFDKASLLVAGMTQMGKTTLINGLITCLLIAYGEFDLYLLDGKFCGLTRFEPIATRYESSDDPAVFWDMVRELNGLSDSRYGQIKEAIRNRKPVPKFRPVFFIVDEAADFFASGGTNEEKDQAKQIANDTRQLVSKSLESGISTVLMTQRPSVNAIPVEVRDQFLYRMCLYVASQGTAKVALGDTYFETIAPINPALLDPDIKGQAVLFANGRSTLIRGFNFEDNFIWDVVDEKSTKLLEKIPEETPLRQAIELMRSKGVDFMTTPDMAPALGILEDDPVKRGKKLNELLGGPRTYKGSQGRGYRLVDLLAFARADS
ncbi:S-DNA-T family DNA segregation ATPase FtsK/SpoIIIE [Streptomyces sp. T12]|uniref:FtsK/SpoIIIE domain-containing protein n=1 Tax=Streptomyces sp. T12 TaxID=477697 RepID=UPI0011ACBEE3|nr:FtsK/SpoIIIE domain-containing protein [Streptomyces sp. T12]TWD13119.1 S-DNA-T family DNA segregation ATPase FtsK/SpoIIIE [Streptomyces sp. T12]